jgi:hypothetical protein
LGRKTEEMILEIGIQAPKFCHVLILEYSGSRESLEEETIAQCRAV